MGVCKNQIRNGSVLSLQIAVLSKDVERLQNGGKSVALGRLRFFEFLNPGPSGDAGLQIRAVEVDIGSRRRVMIASSVAAESLVSELCTCAHRGQVPFDSSYLFSHGESAFTNSSANR